MEIMSAGWHYATMPLHWLDGLFGGGSGGTVMPPIEVPLPDEDDIEVTKYQARSDATAKNAVLSLSPALQVFKYAAAEEYDRYDADLTLLGPAQKAWLRSLSEDDLRTVAAADPRKIDRVLKGENFVLPGIDSVGHDSRPKDVEFAERLRAARSVANERDCVRAL